MQAITGSRVATQASTICFTRDHQFYFRLGYLALGRVCEEHSATKTMVLEEGAPILEKPFTGDELLTILVRRCAK